MRKPVSAVVAAVIAIAAAVAIGSQPTSGADAPPKTPVVTPPQTTPPRPTPAPTPTPTPTPVPAKPAPVPVPVPAAAKPEPVTGNSYAVNRDLENQIALLFGLQPRVLFLGDSITDFLAHAEGKPLWDSLFSQIGVLNFAVAGARTSHVLWQVEQGQVAMAAPKVVVLMIGTNNLSAGEKPQDVVAGVEKIVTTINKQLPKTQILLVSILPRGKAKDPLRPLIVETNQLLADLESDRVTFLDISAWYALPDTALSVLYNPDALHLNFMGYFVYTLTVWEPLMDLLSKP